MPTANYNKADMETVISNSATILTNITTTADSIDGIVGSVDRRVYDYFDFFRYVVSFHDFYLANPMFFLILFLLI